MRAAEREAKLVQLRRLRFEGKTIAQIAAALQISRTTVVNWSSWYGMPSFNRMDWNAESLAQLRRMRDAGISNKDIGLHFGLDAKDIGGAVRRYNLPKRKAGINWKDRQKFWTPERVQLLKALRTAGHTNIKIAKFLKVTESAVDNAVRSFNLLKRNGYDRSATRRCRRPIRGAAQRTSAPLQKSDCLATPD